VHIAFMGKKRNACRDLVGSPLGRQRCRWEDNVMDLRLVGWGSMNWFHLAQDRDQWLALVNTVVYLRVS
jgi:hypothetical protein